MPTDTTVKFIHSGMANSPALSGTVGALIGVLDACLVNGFGLVSVTSLVIAGGVATGTVSAGHSFEPGTVMTIAGAVTTGGSVNGEQKAVATAANTFTFETTLADQTATGTITAKVAPLGWSNSDVAPGTNIKAYRPTDVASTRFYLRVDDTDAREARWMGYETMSDINTGTNPWATAIGGSYVAKSQSADATAREWTLIGDGKRFYLNIRGGGNSGAVRTTVLFGDFISRKSPDAYACHMAAHGSTYHGNLAFNSIVAGSVAYCGSDTSALDGQSPRGVSGLGGPVPARRVPASSLPNNGTFMSGANSTSLIVYPNTAGNELLLSEIHLYELTPNLSLRGKLSGVYFCPQSIGYTEFAHRQTVTGVSSLPGKTLRAIVGTSGAGGAGYGPLFFDVTGPWA
jgi:hypothetical protein